MLNRIANRSVTDHLTEADLQEAENDEMRSCFRRMKSKRIK